MPHPGHGAIVRRGFLGGLVLAGVGWRRALADVDRAAIAKLIETLRSSPSYKVRMHAAALLASHADPGVFAALAEAARADREPAVRAVAVRLLARNPGGDPPGRAARVHISRALSDPAPTVRQAARDALPLLAKNLRLAARRPGKAGVAGPAGSAKPARAQITIIVGRIGGRAPDLVREYMRTQLRGNLQRNRRVSVLEDGAEGAIFIIDGTIKQLSVAQRRSELEATAAVDLVVSKPPRGILLVASGEAVVQKSQRFLAANLRTEMMEEAVEHALGSAHENLDQFLAQQP